MLIGCGLGVERGGPGCDPGRCEEPGASGAHEHCRAGAGVCPGVARAGRAGGLGVAALSALRGDADLQERRATGAGRGSSRGGGRCGCSGTGATAVGGRYSERSALLVRGSWYAREVHRCAIDHWQHVGSSARRTAEVLRSWLGRQERWQLWRPLDRPPAERERCHLSASTVERWLDRAGRRPRRTVGGQLAGCAELGAAGDRRAVGAAAGRDHAGGACCWSTASAGWSGRRSWWPRRGDGPALGDGCSTARTSGGAGAETLRGVASDGAPRAGELPDGGAGVGQPPALRLPPLARPGGRAGARRRRRGRRRRWPGRPPTAARRQARRELVGLVRGGPGRPERGRGPGGAGRPGGARARGRPARAGRRAPGGRPGPPAAATTAAWRARRPEWLWRDFRLRLSHGRNHGSEQRLERAALVWAIYHNFTPPRNGANANATIATPAAAPSPWPAPPREPSATSMPWPSDGPRPPVAAQRQTGGTRPPRPRDTRPTPPPNSTNTRWNRVPDASGLDSPHHPLLRCERS